jgi:hypothetical protein
MAATLIAEDAEHLVIQISIPKSRCFLQCEEKIQDALNDAGRLATGKCLEDFDSDGLPILIAGNKLTAKRTKIARKYETPYGVVPVARYAYQSPQGGEVYIPLESNARIIGGTTPRFAKIVSCAYAHNNALVVQDALRQSLHRSVSKCYIQDLSAAVAAHLEDKSRHWDYAKSEPLAHQVAFIAIGIDGTTLLFCEEGYRQAMVGSIAFYDALGQRLHTNYVAAAPEHGKATFLRRMEEEIARIKARHPGAVYLGISDGASDYLAWLKAHTETQILDFWHVSEYIHAAAEAMEDRKGQREAWIEAACQKLKHEDGAARRLLESFRKALHGKKLTAKKKAVLEAAISYFGNNLERMDYARYHIRSWPLGSGVTEAACKSVVKTRLCGSGMKWTQRGADVVLTLRALALTPARWEQFWRHTAQYGLQKLRPSQHNPILNHQRNSD